jgi:hypothetical protein
LCQQLRDIRNAFTRYAESFDPAVLLGSQAQAAISEIAAIEATAATLKALAARRAAQAQTWRGTGHKNAAEALSHQTGASIAEAIETLKVGDRLADQPEITAAALSGKLSPRQVSLISDAADADPASGAHLLDVAQRLSIAELRDEVTKIKASATDLEARHRRVHDNRRLHPWTDTEGAWHLKGIGTPDTGAQIMAAIEPRRDQLFRAARAEGRREHPDAYAYDALLQLCVEATSAAAPVTSGPVRDTAASDLPDALAESIPPASGNVSKAARPQRLGAPVKLLVRIDLDTFLKGVTGPGETCELAGYGPVPPPVVNALLEKGDPFVVAVLTKAKRVVGVAHLGRAPTAHQKSALEWLYPTCAAEGCVNRAHLQADHRIDWAQTHITMLDHLDMLCAHHHALKTRENWALAPGQGKRPFVEPNDPRHPGRHRRERAP